MNFLEALVDGFAPNLMHGLVINRLRQSFFNRFRSFDATRVKFHRFTLRSRCYTVISDVPGRIDDVINARGKPEIAVVVSACTVAGHVEVTPKH